MRERIRLYGARLYRFTARLAIFVGMMGLYSLALGSSDWHLLYGAVLVAGLTVGLIGNLGTAIAEKATGADLGFAYLAFSAFAGSLALSCGEALVNVLRFRKLQKAYRDPRYQQKLLDAAVYQELKAQVERRRAEEKEG